ncbi:MAG: riboflavin synthase [Geminocystis sp.]|nr:riboflavin synthase [Geminocystis sp.]MCX8078362.1 riboflavin synthase [Geminocystis sp.]HIK38331.1 riboflavin synthase [Geminocystis sp. M7585_C2015_104]
MFTGLIQAKGTIKLLGNNLYQVAVEEDKRETITADLAIGDSVAVDGICLTVEEITTTGFTATASPETLKRTTLSQTSMRGKIVNLETSLRVGSKIGGHFVSGHVDGIGSLAQSVKKQQSWEMTFTPPTSLQKQWQTHIAPYIVFKGSIAVNGISLTIADCDEGGSWFTVAVIPHTYFQTNLSLLQPGDWVNLETDILAKYVSRFLRHCPQQDSPISTDITREFLLENGYINSLF